MTLEFADPYRNLEIKMHKVGGGHQYSVSGYPDRMRSVTTRLGVLDKPGIPIYRARTTASRFANRLLAIEPGNLPPGATRLEDEQAGDVERYAAYIEELREFAEQEERQAADDGTAAHALIQAALTGQQVDESEVKVTDEVRARVKPATDAAPHVIATERFQVVDVERPVFHPILQFAGTIDLIVRDRHGTLAVLDWKRSKSLYSNYAYQASAYAEALAMLLDYTEPVAAYCVQLPQEVDQEWDCKQVNVPAMFQRFLAAMAASDLIARDKKDGVWI